MKGRVEKGVRHPHPAWLEPWKWPQGPDISTAVNGSRHRRPEGTCPDRGPQQNTRPHGNKSCRENFETIPTKERE